MTTRPVLQTEVETLTVRASKLLAEQSVSGQNRITAAKFTYDNKILNLIGTLEQILLVESGFTAYAIYAKPSNVIGCTAEFKEGIGWLGCLGNFTSLAVLQNMPTACLGLGAYGLVNNGMNGFQNYIWNGTSFVTSDLVTSTDGRTLQSALGAQFGEALVAPEFRNTPPLVFTTSSQPPTTVTVYQGGTQHIAVGALSAMQLVWNGSGNVAIQFGAVDLPINLALANILGPDESLVHVVVAGETHMTVYGLGSGTLQIVGGTTNEDNAKATLVYVSPTGSVTPDGTASNPYTLAELPAHLPSQIGVSPVAILLRGGDYEIASTVALTGLVGTAKAPVTIKPSPGESVRIRGGKKLANTDFALVTSGDSNWSRIAVAARGNVQKTNVNALLGINGSSTQAQKDVAYGVLRQRGFAETWQSMLEVAVDKAPARLARWPKRGATVLGPDLLNDTVITIYGPGPMAGNNTN